MYSTTCSIQLAADGINLKRQNCIRSSIHFRTRGHCRYYIHRRTKSNPFRELESGRNDIKSAPPRLRSICRLQLPPLLIFPFLNLIATSRNTRIVSRHTRFVRRRPILISLSSLHNRTTPYEDFEILGRFDSFAKVQVLTRTLLHTTRQHASSAHIPIRFIAHLCVESSQSSRRTSFTLTLTPSLLNVIGPFAICFLPCSATVWVQRKIYSIAKPVRQYTRQTRSASLAYLVAKPCEGTNKSKEDDQGY